MKIILLITISVFFISKKSNSQILKKFKIKKNNSLIYFFQKENKNDTLSLTKNNLFYLIIPDTLKDKISVFIDNAMLQKTENDSLLSLKYMPGLKYESFYEVNEQIQFKATRPKQYDFKTLINGTSILYKNTICIQLVKRIEGLVIIKNFFIIK